MLHKMEINKQLIRNARTIPKGIPPTIAKDPVNDHETYIVRREIFFYCFTYICIHIGTVGEENFQ